MDDDRLNVTANERAAFFSRVAIKGPEDCWLWTGATQKPGSTGQLPYAITRFRGVQMNGHRLAWMIETDRPIPAGKVIRHTCHVANCCNPRHLLIGTPRDNAHDTLAAGRHKPGISFGHSPTMEEAEALEIAASGLPSLAAMSRHYRRCASTIRNAFRRYGIPRPKSTRRTDDEWRAIAALNLPTFVEIERQTGATISAVRMNFARLGLPLTIKSTPKYDDDYWRALAATNPPSVAYLSDRYGHCRKVIHRAFKRLGLPLPSGRHRPCGDGE